MSKFKRKVFGVVGCPNGCGKTFKLNFKNKPEGMAKHLENCGGTFLLADGLGVKEGVGDGRRLCSNE